MNDVVTTPTPSIFGEGAPSGTAQNGVRYFDTTVSPYQEYVYFGGAWQGPLGGGGGGSGLPYTSAGGPPPDWLVNAPYNFYIYSGYRDVGGNKQFGGAISLVGYYAAQTYTAYGGDINIFAGGAYTAAHSCFGGRVQIYAGDAYGMYGFGGDINLHVGYGTYQNGQLFIFNLPTAPPGGTNKVWNNLGVLTIT